LVTLSNDDIKRISLFESMTGALAEDCIVEGDRLAFIVKEGDVGRAIGRNGETIRRVREAFGKRVDVFENAETMEKFIRNLFPGIEIRELKVSDADGAKAVQIAVGPKDRGPAIGRDGERIKLARAILERRYGAKLKLV